MTTEQHLLNQEPEKLYFRLKINNPDVEYHWSLDGENWNQIGSCLALTDLGNWAEGTLAEFTGTFVGITCQDTVNRTAWAHFHSFSYLPL